jgi:hydrogenase/urease accessory protein HupE
MRIRVSVALIALLGAASAAAHPGHGAEGSGWSALHHLGEPEHLGASALLLLAVSLWHALRARASRPGS